MFSLIESYFFYLAILGEQKFSCTGISIFSDSYLVQTYLTKQHTIHTNYNNNNDNNNKKSNDYGA